MQPQQQPRIQQDLFQQRRPPQQINRGMQQQTGNLQYNTRPQNQEKYLRRGECYLQETNGWFYAISCFIDNTRCTNRKSAMSNKIVPTNSYDMSNVNYNNVNETIKISIPNRNRRQNFLKNRKRKNRSSIKVKMQSLINLNRS